MNQIDDTVKFYSLYILGKHVRIDAFSSFVPKLYTGDYVHISKGVTVIGGVNTMVTLKGFNNICTRAMIATASDAFDGSGMPGSMIPLEFKGKIYRGDIVIERFANMGMGSVMMPGSHLSEGVLLTMGSVLFGDTVPWGVYKGNPAKLVRIIDKTEVMKKYDELQTKIK